MSTIHMYSFKVYRPKSSFMPRAIKERGVDQATRHPHPLRSFHQHSPALSSPFENQKLRMMAFDGGREFQVNRSVSSLFRHSVPCDHALRFHPREIFPPAAPFVAGMEGPL